MPEASRAHAARRYVSEGGKTGFYPSRLSRGADRRSRISQHDDPQARPMPAYLTVLGAIAQVFARAGAAWSRFWFAKVPTTPLELVRIGIGAVMLANYCLAAPHLFDFWGDNGFMMPRAV